MYKTIYVFLKSKTNQDNIIYISEYQHMHVYRKVSGKIYIKLIRTISFGGCPVGGGDGQRCF